MHLPLDLPVSSEAPRLLRCPNVQKYLEGCDVVYGVRNKRDTDTWFKRTTAVGFYRFMATMRPAYLDAAATQISRTVSDSSSRCRS